MLNALMSIDFDGVDQLRREAEASMVIGGCGCGRPSIDFCSKPGQGMHIRVNASHGDFDGLFLFTLGGRLGGIEAVGASGDGDPADFPDPATLSIKPA